MVRLVRNMSGVCIDFDNAVNFMDNDLCERVYNQLYPTEQEIFTAYEQAYLDKYGEVWEFSKSNPQI